MDFPPGIYGTQRTPFDLSSLKKSLPDYLLRLRRFVEKVRRTFTNTTVRGDL